MPLVKNFILTASYEQKLQKIERNVQETSQS